MSGITLDEIVFTTGAGAVDADTLRVHLSDESLAALENITVDISGAVADDDADSGNPVKIGGRGVSGALTALSASGDRFDLLGDLYRRVWVNSSANIGMNTEAASVTTTAAQVLGTALAGRRAVTIQNNGSQDVFLVESGATAKAAGLKIPKRSSATYDLGPDIDIYLVADSGTQDVRLLEVA